MDTKSFQVLFEHQDARQPILVSGHNAWALKELIHAGVRGCTPIDTPGPRWSGYVHNLRNLGLEIETVPEAHGGQFPGTYARYILRSSIRLEPYENDEVKSGV